jgi:hypothetical protein
MNRGRNQYPEFWAEGYQAVGKERLVIRCVITAENGMVLVFDEAGEQIPEYQGRYHEVKPRILKDAPPGTVFSYALQLNNKTKIKIVTREEW